MEDRNSAIRDIIAYLNERTSSRFRPSSDNAVKHIGARLDEGRTMEDFRLVIDLKASEWMNNPPWDTYLRPRTLFGSKFDGYLETARRKKKASESKPMSSFRGDVGDLLDWLRGQ